jgi:signal transduction histidine kinase
VEVRLGGSVARREAEGVSGILRAPTDKVHGAAQACLRVRIQAGRRSSTMPRKRFTSRLFLRIYATFVGTVLVFALLVGALVWAATSSWRDERIAGLVEPVEAVGEPLANAVKAGDEAEITAIVGTLEAELDAEIVVLPRVRGRRFGAPIGEPGGDHAHDHPPAHELPLTKADILRIRQGQPLVRRRGLAPPTIALALFESGFDRPHEFDDEDAPVGRAAQRGRMIALVTIEPQQRPSRGLIAVGLALLLALGGGAWPLARSLTSRLDKLERSTRALAGGELSHRAELSHPQPRDEVDRLAVAFNDMADRLETLVTGQRTLLANVSHELRTPIARTKVLLEILGERVEHVRAAEQAGEPVHPDDVARIERGLAEMHEDLAEVEGLIQDLLTSGRLELNRDSALALEPLDLAQLCESAARRFAATVECPAGLTFEGDRMLLERLLKNLLANARRACPEGNLVIRGAREHDELHERQQLLVEIEDDGPGIPVGKRSFIFEPFARLDSARARDEGGVGLGLYLCRQIASAHRGTVRVEEREDGRPGARFVIRLPA